MAAEAARPKATRLTKNYDEAVKKYTEAIAFDATQHLLSEPRSCYIR